MYASDLFEQNKPRVVVTYPGRFQPFHQGHAGVFSQLQKKFGAENVFVLTSNDTSSAKSPFNFSDKYQLMTAAGIPANHIVETNKMYILPDGIDPRTTIFVTAVGGPDKDRLNPDTFTKRDQKDKDGNVTKPAGSPSYYRTWGSDKNPVTADQHGYVIVIPEIQKNVELGGKSYDASHGTEVRQLWNMVRNNPKQRAEFLKQLYKNAHQDLIAVFNKIPETVNESLNEFANDKWEDGDPRSRLIGAIAQLLKSGKKVDFFVPGIRGHVSGIGGQGDWLTLKRWNKPYSKINYSLALDSSDDNRFALKMIKPDYYQVVEKKDLNEFAPSGDDGRENNPEDVLFRFAKMWYSAPDVATQQRVEQALAKIGWDIGELESEEGGAYVMRVGDDNGDSYIGWSEEQLANQLNEFAPDEGGGARKFIPWTEFIEQVKQIVGKDFDCVENVVKTTIKARFVPHDPMEYGPTMLYSYYETRAGGRNKGAVSTRGAIQVGKYTGGGLTGQIKGKLLTTFSLLKGHPFERHFDLTFDNIYKIANIILGNTQGALEFKPEQIAESFNSKQDVINHFVKQGKPAAAGAAAWERGWRGPKAKTPTTQAPKSPQQKYWWQDKDLDEDASGVIASKKQAKDPRYSMSLTKDVRPGQVEKNLRAFKLAELREPDVQGSMPYQWKRMAPVKVPYSQKEMDAINSNTEYWKKNPVNKPANWDPKYPYSGFYDKLSDTWPVAPKSKEARAISKSTPNPARKPPAPPAGTATAPNDEYAATMRQKVQQRSQFTTPPADLKNMPQLDRNRPDPLVKSQLPFKTTSLDATADITAEDSVTKNKKVTKVVKPDAPKDMLRAFRLSETWRARKRIAEGTDAGVDKQAMSELVKKFMPIAMSQLKIDKLPPIVLKSSIEAHDGQATFGRFDNDSGKVYLAIANRHPVDILRTLAHELVHYKQHLDGEMYPGAGETGSPIENEAHVIAGVIMRHFNKKYPDAIKTDALDEDWSEKYKRSIDCSNPKGFSQKAHCAGKKKNEDVGEYARTAAHFIPGVGPALAAYDVASDLNAGKFKDAALSALGFIPGVKGVQISKAANIADTLAQNNNTDTTAAAIAPVKPAATTTDNPTDSVDENFADGKNPQDKGDSKRYNVPTKASVSTLRKVAKQGGRRGQLAHWMANMKAGKAKKNG